jgi:hypothetical protein
MDSCESAAIHAARSSFRAKMKNIRVHLQFFYVLKMLSEQKAV